MAPGNILSSPRTRIGIHVLTETSQRKAECVCYEHLSLLRICTSWVCPEWKREQLYPPPSPPPGSKPKESPWQPTAALTEWDASWPYIFSLRHFKPWSSQKRWGGTPASIIFKIYKWESGNQTNWDGNLELDHLLSSCQWGLHQGQWLEPRSPQVGGSSWITATCIWGELGWCTSEIKHVSGCDISGVYSACIYVCTFLIDAFPRKV